MTFGNSAITKPEEICEKLNEYFCNVGKDLASKLPAATNTVSDYMRSPFQKTIFVEPVTSDELCALINNLNVNKSCGDDGFSPRLVKDCKHVLIEPLVYIYNLSLSNGVVPQTLKIAKVIPLFKKGDVSEMSNYRPISLLSVFNKLLEKIVYKRVYSFLTKNNLLYEYQFGFREKHSTSLALMDVVDYCYKTLDEGNKMLGIFFDLQKAFDTCDHDILLEKLYYYGIRGLMFDWFKSYLNSRQQYTIVNGVSSSLNVIHCGVPQGSVLGPLLFLVYVNDISAVIENNKLKLFADDTNLFVFGKTYEELEIKANECLTKMNSWFLVNKLSLNVGKTCFTIFTTNNRRKNDEKINLKIAGQDIVQVVSCKYLGVTIDENFSWKYHIENVYKKLVKFTALFYKVRHLVPFSCLRMLYYALVYPHIVYCIEVYANTYKSYLAKLQVLVNKIIRILLKVDIRTPLTTMYHSLNTMSLLDLHELHLLKFIHKCLHHTETLPAIFQDYFRSKKSVHLHFTRGSDDLYLPLCTRSIGQRMSVVKGSKCWNMLPVDLKQCSSFAVFLKRLKVYMSDRALK